MNKYRGQSTDTGEWVYGSYQLGKEGQPHVISWWFVHQHEDEISDCVDVAEVIPETVGQYIGSKDKYGMEIYAGQFVKVLIRGGYSDDFCDKEYTRRVEYNEKEARWSPFDVCRMWRDDEGNLSAVEVVREEAQ